MTTFYVTFGQQYPREPHPTFGKAHRDGWVEIEADDEMAARKGCRGLARFGLVVHLPRGRVRASVLPARLSTSDRTVTARQLALIVALARLVEDRTEAEQAALDAAEAFLAAVRDGQRIGTR